MTLLWRRDATACGASPVSRLRFDRATRDATERAARVADLCEWLELQRGAPLFARHFDELEELRVVIDGRSWMVSQKRESIRRIIIDRSINDIDMRLEK